MKQERSRKEWIKNILIIFLVVLLLLTFFSNTIMNYSLAEVSSAYISSGSISTAIRGSGVIQSVDPYNVTITEGRKVESVNIRRGAVVEKGDVLFVLEEGDSTEVTAAKKAYQDLLEAYQTTIIENKITSDVVSAAEAHDEGILNDKMAKLESALDLVNTRQDALDKIDAQLSVLGVTIVDVSNEKAQLDAATVNLDAAKDRYDKEKKTYDDTEAEIVSIQNEFFALSAEEQEKKRDEVVSRLVVLASVKDTAKINMDAANADVERYTKLIESINKQIADKQGEPSEASKELTYQRALAANSLSEAQNSYNSLYDEIKFQMQLEDMLDDIAEAKENWTKIESKAIGTEVLAPVSGTITSVNVVAGETVAADATMAVIQMSGKEYILEMTVTKEQAAKIRIGDVGSVSNSWYYSDITLTVSAIRNDVSNPTSGNRIVVFTVTGSDINVGQSVTVSVGDKSANYDMIVPNTAIREDKNGTYILIITSKSTPLGNRYTATRVDVTKLASDDTNTAISCGLEGYESVITTATKPVSAGDQVRLPN